MHSVAMSKWNILTVSHLRDGSDAAVLGALGGILHHLLFQYPSQAGVFATIYAFVAADALFLLQSIWGTLHKDHSWTSTLKALCAFHFIYVTRIINCH
jgi:hypothetical protein